MQTKIEGATPTARPWSRNIKSKGKYPVIFSGRNNHVTVVCQQPNPDETEANIDLICEAVNLFEAHEAVAEALQKVCYFDVVKMDALTVMNDAKKALSTLSTLRQGGGK